MSNIRALFWDLGNVVARFDNAKTSLAIQERTEPDELITAQDAHRLLFDRDLGLVGWLSRGKMGWNEFRVWVYRLFGLDAERWPYAEFDEAFMDVFTVNQQVHDLIKLGFRRRGHYELVAVSDIEEPRHRQLVKMCILGPNGLFDHEVLSYQEGRIKRDGPELFWKALERSGCAPHEALFVDDLSQNVHQAEELGIRSYCYDGDYDRLFSWLNDVLR